MKKPKFSAFNIQQLLLLFLFFPVGFFSIAPSEKVVVSGHTSGQFAVNDGGSATYSIPITISPGTGGVEPKLALTYSSQGGGGLVGQGWSLQGLSVISRSTQTLEQDGKVRGIDLTKEDTYSLDGERLVPINGNNGANSTEYRTEQNAFLRIISYGSRSGSPERFKTWTKSGLEMEYGYVGNSQIEAQGTSKILFWLLSKVTDTKGNYYTITYQENENDGEYYPTRIDYTANDAAGLSPYNSVQFFYEDRDKESMSFISGSKLAQKRILTRIAAFHGSSVYREYLLDYQCSRYANHYLLKRVQECADGDCFAPTTFDWLEEKQFRFITEPTNTLPSADLKGSNRVLYSGDWNGDGATDLMRLDAVSGANKWYLKTNAFEYGTSYNNPIPISQLKQGGLLFGDFNADGYTDFVWYKASTGENRWFINNQTPNLSFTQHNNLIPTSSLVSDANIFFSDFNGDGLTDVAAYKKSTGFNRVFLNTFSSNRPLGFTQSNSLTLNNSEIDGGTGLFPGDWNNDGMTDLLWYNKDSGTNKWYLNTGQNTFAAAKVNPITPSTIDKGTKIDFGDWNGDGLSDLLWYDEATGATVFYYNKGNLTFEKINHSLPTAPIKGTNSGLVVLDFNGDGVSDLIYYRKESGDNKWYLNDGHGNFSRPLNPAQPSVAGYENPIPRSAIDGGTTIQFGSYGEDSIIDLMWYDNATGTNRWYCNNIVRYNLVNAITNGIGAKTEVSYGSLTDQQIYTKENSALFPNMDFQARLPVVKSFTVEDGIGGRNEMIYCYKGAKINVQGRGFRGFTEITTTDVTTGIRETRFFEKDYRYISSPLLRSETRLVDGTLLSETVNQNGLKLFYDGEPKVHFSYVAQSITNSYELDGSLVTTKRVAQAFDDYGNAILSVVDYGDGHKDSTVNTYNNFVLNEDWILGRLTRAEVHRYAPNVPKITKVAGFEYDSDSGLLTKEITEPDSAANRQIVKSYVHDVFGNIIESQVTAHNGKNIETRKTYTSFSDNGRFTLAVANEFGHKELREYDIITGFLKARRDANGHRSTFEYDSFGRKARETLPDGNWMTYAYQKCTNNCPPRTVYYVTQNASNGNPSTTYFDIVDREIATKAISFDGRTVWGHKEYNKRGLVIRSSDPYFEGDTPNFTTMAYDAIGREVSQTLPGNRKFTTSYYGLTNSTTNPLNQIKTIITNAAGRNIRVLDNASNELTYQYNAQGNRTHIIDPLGNVIKITYDHWGRKIKTEDPDLGTIRYEYNQFDELIREIDAKGQITELEYDRLGRLIKRTEEDVVTTWTFDAAMHGVGLVASITTNDGYEQSFHYDNLSRVRSESETIEGEAYISSFTYDDLGRVESVAYPSGYEVKQVYNQYFFLSEVREKTANKLLWKADLFNAKGQALKTTLGNGLTTQFTYDGLKDYLQGIHTGDGVTTIQDVAYSFNNIGHLTQRKDHQNNLTENFQYDALNRLKAANIVNGTSLSMQYDVLGNITYKSDVGTYTYGENGAGPHAVTSIETINEDVCIPSAVTDLTYTSFDKVKRIERGLDRLDISYGAGHQRTVQRTYKGDNLQKTKIHVGGLYEKETTDNGTQELHYIRAGGGVVAVFNKRSNNSTEYNYWHKDHLGSLQAITDDLKVLVQELSYDAWGKRRNPDGTAIEKTSVFEYDRGFTGHEHIDLFELVNMNGRIYDPVLGRFISPDPAIQDVTNLQNLNRYTYVLNNPLSFTDPSGYFFKKLFKKAKRFVKQYGVMIAAIAVGIITAGTALYIAGFALATLEGAILSAAAYGFGSTVTSTLLTGGSVGDALKSGIKSAVISGFTAALTFGVGTAAQGLAQTSQLAAYGFKVVAHGVIQGVSTEAQGGQFEHGFLAGAFSAGISPALDLEVFQNNPSLSVLTEATIGGTASKLGGGKFANGAVSGAFISIFNGLSHGENLLDNEAFKDLAVDIAIDVAVGLALTATGVGAVFAVYKIAKWGVTGAKFLRRNHKFFTNKSGNQTTIYQYKNGKNFRIDFDKQNGLHYHRRGVDINGTTNPGQGIGRHRPWQKKSTDKSFLDRF